MDYWIGLVISLLSLISSGLVTLELYTVFLNSRKPWHKIACWLSAFTLVATVVLLLMFTFNR